MAQNSGTRELLALIREDKLMTWKQQLELFILLSFPSILAQVSSVVMQYIDASMVGHLGASEAASIGLVSTSTWLFGGLCGALATGFSVQVAHRIGANDHQGARNVVRQGILTAVSIAFLLSAIALAISPFLPGWLGAPEEIRPNASLYFFIYALAIPLMELNNISGGMLRCSGNMKVPSILNILLCIQDVIYNFFLIFPSREISLFGQDIWIPGAGLGVAGAAWGTLLAIAVTAFAKTYYLFFRCKELDMKADKGSWKPAIQTLKRAANISSPIALERVIMIGAQIVTTTIIAPLGTFAIAANSFGITIESLCYMPGYGIADASTTLVGQSLGAKRKKLTKWFSVIGIIMGMGVMTIMGAIMYFFAPEMMSLITNEPGIISLGADVLKIEAFAEPMFAASIVSYGILVGSGNTMISSATNFCSIWLVRITLAFLLAPSLGLMGVWIAMAIELCFRGIVFLIIIFRWKWLNKVL